MKEKLKVLSKKWWFWLIVVVVVCSLFSAPTEEKETPKDENNVKEQEKLNKVVFLKGTNAEEFIEALEGVTEIDDIKGKVRGDSINYSKANSKYSVNLDANKDTKEIDYVRIIALTEEDATNVFMALNRMDYETQNAGEFTKWLVANLGKESTTKIGDANFTLSLSTSGNPIIEMKTDGYDDYSKEQMDKITEE